METNNPRDVAASREARPFDDAAGASATRTHPKDLRAQKSRDRGGFQIALGVEIERADRYDRPLSLALIRVRRAPRAHASIWQNQRRVLLTELSDCVIEFLRLPDFAAQVHENDFAICFPETRLAGAVSAMDKLMSSDRISALCARFGQGGVGVDWRAVEREPGEASTEALLARAATAFGDAG